MDIIKIKKHILNAVISNKGQALNDNSIADIKDRFNLDYTTAMSYMIDAVLLLQDAGTLTMQELKAIKDIKSDRFYNGQWASK